MALAQAAPTGAQIIPFRQKRVSEPVPKARPAMEPCVDIHAWYHEAAVQDEKAAPGKERGS